VLSNESAIPIARHDDTVQRVVCAYPRDNSYSSCRPMELYDCEVSDEIVERLLEQSVLYVEYTARQTRHRL
jgi:hypothetical protein